MMAAANFAGSVVHVAVWTVAVCSAAAGSGAVLELLAAASERRQLVYVESAE